MKKVITLLFLSIIVLASCGGGGGGGSSNTATLASISILPKDNVIAAGTTRQFTATGTYSDSSTQDLTTSVTWNSSNTSVATVGPTSGKVTAVTAGVASITATSGGIQGTTTLTVPAHSLVSITVTPVTSNIAPGTSRQFAATGTYLDGATQDLTASATWSSSSTAVATIEPATGKATAVGGGTTTITAILGTISGTATLTVATPDTISITPANPTLATGTTQQFTAKGTFLGTTTTQDLTTSVSWNSSNTLVATIDPASGKASAVGGGTTTITATLGTISGSTTLTVPIPPATVVSIAITPANPSIINGMTQQFTAIGTLSGSNPNQDLTTSVAWSSSNTSVATIDPASGKATAASAGTTTITADLGGGISGSTTLTVTPFTVAGTWTGTYTIYDSLDTSQIGTYTFEFVLTQSGTSVAGTATLRGNTPGQTSATGQLTGTVTGRQMNLSFTYTSPQSSKLLTDIGTSNITGGTMAGSVIENYDSIYNCSYTFVLTKQ